MAFELLVAVHDCDAGSLADAPGVFQLAGDHIGLVGGHSIRGMAALEVDRKAPAGEADILDTVVVAVAAAGRIGVHSAQAAGCTAVDSVDETHSAGYWSAGAHPNGPVLAAPLHGSP